MVPISDTWVTESARICVVVNPRTALDVRLPNSVLVRYPICCAAIVPITVVVRPLSCAEVRAATCAVVMKLMPSPSISAITVVVRLAICVVVSLCSTIPKPDRGIEPNAFSCAGLRASMPVVDKLSRKAEPSALSDCDVNPAICVVVKEPARKLPKDSRLVVVSPFNWARLKAATSVEVKSWMPLAPIALSVVVVRAAICVVVR